MEWQLLNFDLACIINLCLIVLLVTREIIISDDRQTDDYIAGWVWLVRGLACTVRSRMGAS